ncbi:MAG: nucleotide exchange factor GrpE [Bacillota bacterium]|nr:nucleotide exchange factor GrpE [Bacillota bacterium]
MMTNKKKDELQEEIDAKADETVEEAAEETAEEIEEKEDSGEEKREESEESELNEESKEEPEEPAEDENVKYLRLMADFQNYKKRVEKEKKDLYAYANENIMNDLLTVLDNFERALDHDDGEGFKEGVEMIFKQLGDALEKSGLAEIPALGEEFDPNKHNAVMTEDTDEYESGKVSVVMHKGYTLNGKVIRPSMVKVAN